jgi:uncharacterized protein YodC (DUF2158 family)
MSDTQFKAGEVVMLKSGGPEMTIEDIAVYGMGSSHKSAKCVWFDGKKRMEALFELHTLKSAV